MPSKSSHHGSRSPSCSAARKAPSVRLILTVIAINQLAATNYISVPYLETTLPPPMRLARFYPPFEFKPLRVQLDAAKKINPTEGELSPPDKVPPPVAGSLVDPLSESQLPFTRSGGGETAVGFEPEKSPASASLAPPLTSTPDFIGEDADSVRLEDLLPFFPSSSEPTGRATFEKQ